MAAKIVENVAGTVSEANGSGFQVQERPGQWLNISQFANPRPELPNVGQKLLAGLDKAGFVQTWAPMEPAPPATSYGATTNGTAPSNRDVSIVRLACLKAAAKFLAERPDAKSTDVLTVAERFESWATR